MKVYVASQNVVLWHRFYFLRKSVTLCFHLTIKVHKKRYENASLYL